MGGQTQIRGLETRGCQSEVEQLDNVAGAAEFTDENIRRADVAVDDIQPMRFRECPADLSEQEDRPRGGEPPSGLHQLPQALAFEVLHHVIDGAVRPTP